jgi:GNAT superfamily N-acetyltransferase
MHFEGLGPGGLDEVIGFVRASNPFAQDAWGWDAGRFADWRWGSNVLKEERAPGWFSRNCTVFRDGSEIKALAISESGTAEHCVITPGPDPALVGEVVEWLAAHRAADGLRFTVADDAGWLLEVLAGRGYRKESATGCEWEFDLTTLPPHAPVPDRFVVEPSAAGDEAEHAGITRCLQRAFGSEADMRPVLRSLESNPLFRTELSVVARTPEGRIAAYCRGTVDPDTGVCGIDPVATDPQYQRLGLGTAVLLRCFETQHRLGGRRCYIGSDPEPSPGAALYRSLGPSRRSAFSTWSCPPPEQPRRTSQMPNRQPPG